MKTRSQVTRIYADGVVQWVGGFYFTRSRQNAKILRTDGGVDKGFLNFEFFLRVFAASREIIFNTKKCRGLFAYV